MHDLGVTSPVTAAPVENTNIAVSRRTTKRQRLHAPKSQRKLLCSQPRLPLRRCPHEGKSRKRTSPGRRLPLVALSPGRGRHERSAAAEPTNGELEPELGTRTGTWNEPERGTQEPTSRSPGRPFAHPSHPSARLCAATRLKLFVCLGLLLPRVAVADAVTDWNLRAGKAAIFACTSPLGNGLA